MHSREVEEMRPMRTFMSSITIEGFKTDEEYVATTLGHIDKEDNENPMPTRNSKS